MAKHEIVVRLDLEIIVELSGMESRQRAADAALGALPQTVYVYIDGEEKPPARVFIDGGEHCLNEVGGETW